MKRSIACMIILLIALVLGLSISGSSTAQPARPIKIGGLFELTGFVSPNGQQAHQGALLAIEQEGGKLLGRPLEFIVEDTATDVPTTMDKARKLVEVDKVKIIVGPIFGPCTSAMAGYLDKVQIPFISIATLDDVIVLKNKWAFGIVGTAETNGYPMGIYAAEKLGYKTVATIGCDLDAGHEFIRGFVLGFQSKGGKVIQQQWSPPNTSNMMPFLIAVDKNADALVTWWPGTDQFAGFKQYKELNLKMPMLQPEDGGILGNPLAAKAVGPGAIGTYTTLEYSYLANTPGNKEFVAAFQKKYGSLPAPLAGCAYVSARVAIEGLKKAGLDSSSKKLKDALTDLKMDTIHGPKSFNKWRIGTYTCPVVRIDEDFVPQIIAEYRVKTDIVKGELVYSLER
ncbi:MAG: ABC transporter substrate-binding protein [Thermodesulfobacteriota bacterium]